MYDFLQSVPCAIILLIAGFVCLVKGADLFVEGSSSIAKKLKVPSIIIGLTIVAMGTSLPETAVSIVAAIGGNNTLAISNVTGSNIFNLMFVIGACAIMTPVAVAKESVRRDIPFSIICAFLLFGFGLWGWELGRIDGAFFVIVFGCYLAVLIRNALKARKESLAAGKNADEGEEEYKLMPVPKSLLFIVIGIIGIVLGGDWVVDGATTIATKFGISQTIIGLTIVAIGTSLPELVTSIVAARKKEVDMALGNAIGSNIYNILMVLGVAGIISPMQFLQENIIDIVILIVFSFIGLIFAATKKSIGRKEGIIMVLLYVADMVYICIR